MIQHPGPRRRLQALAAVIALAAAGVGAAAATAMTAGAEPTQPATCAYSLTPPHLVSVSGADMVTATVTMAGCTGRATPVSSVVCIRAEGSSLGDQCAEGKGTLPAQVYFTPYRPGTTYVSEGRGCANLIVPPSSTCQSVGPQSETL